MSELGHDVGAFMTLLGAAVLIAILAERVRVPAAVALVAIGAFFQIAPPFAFGDTLLFVFLPPLIFEAAWNLDLASLRRMAWRIALLAVPGTLATAAIVAGGVMLVGALPPAPAMLFGAIVAATDPVAVVAAFRRVRVPADLRTLVEGESLSNDGVALILFAFTAAVAGGQATSIGGDALLGVLEVLGGVAIGGVAGLLCAGVLRATDATEYEVTVTIVLAYVAYLAATALHCSGIFATAAGAIALRAAVRRLPGALNDASDVDRVWAALAFMANAVVFLATGLVIRPDRIVHEPVLVLAAVVAVTLARAALALVATRKRNDRITVFLAGMRGALPLALALSLPETLAYRAQIIDATFAVVLVTIVVQGAPLEHVLARLFGGTSNAGAKT
ncbi:MAG: monovalent cation:H+ antiporter, family [Candidatus Eremiobacteraeota bacterium]|jgi:CPA1 family monovalent cation:H+ antiporter|nr:monovalent cation:H+ antiporter, family [Candidatus Eremiobacteraeota bacterium]